MKVYKTTFRPLKFTLSGRNERTLMKLVVDADTERVLGAHMVGPDAPEIIQAIAIAVKAGLTKRDFDATVAIHPTAAEEFVTLKNGDPISSWARDDQHGTGNRSHHSGWISDGSGRSIQRSTASAKRPHSPIAPFQARSRASWSAP